VNASKTYVIRGSAKLGGGMSLTKDGPGLLLLNNGSGSYANEFTGPVTINGGTLRVGYSVPAPACTRRWAAHWAPPSSMMAARST